MSTVTVTSVKGSTEHTSLADAIRALSDEPHRYSAFGPSLSIGDLTTSFDLIDEDDSEYPSIAMYDIEDMLSALDIDCGEDFHWPYAPTTDELADALDRLGK